MDGVMTAPGAVLLELNTIRGRGLVLGHRIVTALAFGASESNHRTHYILLNTCPKSGGHGLILYNLRRALSTRMSMHTISPCKHLTSRIWPRGTKKPQHRKVPGLKSSSSEYYSMMVATRPEPTVWPPSRIAKRRPSSMAIGWMRSPSTVTWSPGITISMPSGSLTEPVTSVVRK